MEVLNSNDAAFLETCHRWLLFHYHCNACGQSEDTCAYGKVCSYGKSTFTHVRGCTRDVCSFPRCALIKSVLRHHQACKDVTCLMCAPVCKYQARNRGKRPPSPLAAEVAGAMSTATFIQGSEHVQLPQPQQLTPLVQVQQSAQRNSCKAELDRAQSQPLLELPQQQHGDMLFEARHREQCQLLTSLGRRSLTIEAAAIAAAAAAPVAACTGPTASAASSSGCTPTSATSGSVEAVAALQGRQVDKLPQLSAMQPPQPRRSTNSESGQVQSSPQQPNLLSSAASPQHISSCSIDNRINPLKPGPEVQHAHVVGPLHGGQVIVGMQQTPQQAVLPMKGQQTGIVYAANGLTVLLQQSPHQQVPAAVVPILQSQNLAQQLQPPTQQANGLQPQLSLPLVPQAVLVPVQFSTPGPFQARSQLSAPPQQFDGATQAIAGAAFVPGQGAAILQTSTGPMLAQPYNALLHTSQQQLQLAHQAAPGWGASSLLPCPHYGLVGQVPNAALPQQQPQLQQFHQQQHIPLVQQHASGRIAGSLAQTAGGPGLLVAMGQGGVGLGAAAPWGAVQLSCSATPLVSSTNGPQIHHAMPTHQPQHVQGHFAAESYSDTGAPVLITPQLTGTT